MNIGYQEMATLFEQTVLLTALKYNSLVYQAHVNTLSKLLKTKQINKNKF